MKSIRGKFIDADGNIFNSAGPGLTPGYILSDLANEFFLFAKAREKALMNELVDNRRTSHPLPTIASTDEKGLSKVFDFNSRRQRRSH